MSLNTKLTYNNNITYSSNISYNITSYERIKSGKGTIATAFWGIG